MLKVLKLIPGLWSVLKEDSETVAQDRNGLGERLELYLQQLQFTVKAVNC